MKKILCSLFLIGLLHNSMVLPAESTAWQRRKQAVLTLWHCGGLSPEKHMCSKEEITSARKKIAAMSTIALGALLTTVGIWYKKEALRKAWNRAKKESTENIPQTTSTPVIVVVPPSAEHVQGEFSPEEEVVFSSGDKEFLKTATQDELDATLKQTFKSIKEEENGLELAQELAQKHPEKTGYQKAVEQKQEILRGLNLFEKAIIKRLK